MERQSRGGKGTQAGRRGPGDKVQEVGRAQTLRPVGRPCGVLSGRRFTSSKAALLPVMGRPGRQRGWMGGPAHPEQLHQPSEKG